MSFLSSSVSIGQDTKKSHFDQLLDNTQYNKVTRDGTVSLIGVKTFQSATIFNATATFNSSTIFNSTATFNKPVSILSSTVFEGPVNMKDSDGLSLIGDSNADRKIDFASDAAILWDESEDKFSIAKEVSVGELTVGAAGITSAGNIDAGDGDFTGDLLVLTRGITSRNYEATSNVTGNTVFDALFGHLKATALVFSTVQPATGYIILSGVTYIIFGIQYVSGLTTVYFYTVTVAGTYTLLGAVDGNGDTFANSMRVIIP